jgi:hypothetical protein
MPNPRYSQREPSRREQKLNEYSQFQEGAQRQQALDANSQASMMQQLAQMYGLQQQSQMDPLRMEQLRASTEAQDLANEQQRFQNDWAQPNAMQGYDMNAAKLAQMPEVNRGMALQNDAQAFQNQWAQPNAMAAYDLAQAQARGLAERTSGAITPQDRLRFLQETGKEYMSPEEKAIAEQKAAKERQALIAADMKQQGSAALPPISQRPNAPPDPGGTWGDVVKGMPGAFAEKAVKIHDNIAPWAFLANLLKTKAY